jgi:DNA polymerase I-like protein with 3'-5' exonuclease and polymerase domains
VSIDDGAPYACEDVIVTHKLNEVLAQELVNYATLYKLYQTLELPLIAVLHLIEGDLLFTFACNISKMGSGVP